MRRQCLGAASTTFHKTAPISPTTSIRLEAAQILLSGGLLTCGWITSTRTGPDSRLARYIRASSRLAWRITSMSSSSSGSAARERHPANNPLPLWLLVSPPEFGSLLQQTHSRTLHDIEPLENL